MWHTEWSLPFVINHNLFIFPGQIVAIIISYENLYNLSINVLHTFLNRIIEIINPFNSIFFVTLAILGYSYITDN